MCKNSPQGTRMENYIHRKSREKKIKETLTKVKEEVVKKMDETILMITKQMNDSLKCCHSEVSKLQKYFESIISKLDEIRRNYEKRLREIVEGKNAEASESRLNLEKKRERVSYKKNTVPCLTWVWWTT